MPRVFAGRSRCAFRFGSSPSCFDEVPSDSFGHARPPKFLLFDDSMPVLSFCGLARRLLGYHAVCETVRSEIDARGRSSCSGYFSHLGLEYSPTPRRCRVGCAYQTASFSPEVHVLGPGFRVLVASHGSGINSTHPSLLSREPALVPMWTTPQVQV